MAANLVDAQPETVPFLVEATKNLAFASLASSQTQSGFDTLPLEAALRQKIERYIDANLGDRGLSTDSLCRDFSISRSTLYRLFDLHAGVANFIKRRRLQRIRAILVTADDLRPLSEISASAVAPTSAGPSAVNSVVSPVTSVPNEAARCLLRTHLRQSALAW